MKSIWVFLLHSILFFKVNTSSVVGDEAEIHAERIKICRAEVGATDADVKMITDLQIPTSHTGLCLLTCLYELSGIIKDGKFDVGVFFKSLDSEQASIGGQMSKRYVDEIARDCKDVSNADKCILSKDIIMCVAESVARHSEKEL